MRTCRLALAILAATTACATVRGPRAAPTPASPPAPRYAWVQMVTGGLWSVRQVLDGAAPCAAGMAPRARPDAAFPLTVCEARLPMRQASATFGGRRYVRPSITPARVAVMGDTGCRVKRNEVQHCDDPRAWPFAQVVRGVAAARPGLVLHLGDFWYRESCQLAAAACAGTGPLGDTWASWEADFFRPAAPLLASAPWIFLRGNHENCDRGGEGWFRLLDPAPRAPSDTACAPFTAPYAVRLARWDLLLMDTGCAANSARCTAQTEATTDEYARELAAVRALAIPRKPAWLATHVPFWAVLRPLGPDSVGTRSLQDALARVGGGLPASVGLLAAGHVHLFQALDFGGSRPPQVVVGNSGTALDPVTAARPAGAPLAGASLARFTGFSGFGYGVVTFSRGTWRIDVRDPAGHALALCRAAARRLECTQP